MKTKTLITVMILAMVGILFNMNTAMAQKAIKIKNTTGTNLGIYNASGRFFLPIDSIKSVPANYGEFNIIAKNNGVNDTIFDFSKEAVNGLVEITRKDITKPAKTTTLFNDAEYAWLAKSGPLSGMYFSATDSLNPSQTYPFPGELPDFMEFNAKVWYKGEKIQRLAIVTTYRDGDAIHFLFRFDQVEGKKTEKFPIANSAGQQVYFKIGGKDVLLNVNDRSRPIKVPQGWYYLEESHKQKTTVWENGQMLQKEEVVTGDILIGIGFHQHDVKITANQLTNKIDNPVPAPSTTTAKSVPPPAKKSPPVIRRR
ncbi:MAG: hypothetical protein WC523_06500 [Patescibacteria group bacterium]|jgi:hypothetical protein